jgi:hypothetical protein
MAAPSPLPGAHVDPTRVETRTGIFWIDGEVLCCQMVRFDGHDLRDAEENMRVARELSGGRRLPLLLDMREARGIDREARAHYASREGEKLWPAVAMLISSPFGVVLGNFFMRVNRPPFPVRIFRDEAAALDWLRATCRAAT